MSLHADLEFEEIGSSILRRWVTPITVAALLLVLTTAFVWAIDVPLQQDHLIFIYLVPTALIAIRYGNISAMCVAIVSASSPFAAASFCFGGDLHCGQDIRLLRQRGNHLRLHAALKRPQPPVHPAGGWDGTPETETDTHGSNFPRGGSRHRRPWDQRPRLFRIVFVDGRKFFGSWEVGIQDCGRRHGVAILCRATLDIHVTAPLASR